MASASPMICFDNIIFELQKAGGISVYWYQLALRSKKIDTLYFGCENSNIFSQNLSFLLRQEIYPCFFPRRYFPFIPKPGTVQADKYIFHSSYYRCSNYPNAINVTTVHDFTYEHHIKGVKGLLHGWQKKNAVKRSAGIICVSENTKRDLIKFYPWVDEARVRVIHNGVGSEFFPVNYPIPKLEDRLSFGVKRPFLMYVGDRSSYKNFDVFVELAYQLPQFDVVVVGGQPFNDAEHKRVALLSGRILHFRGLASEDLNLLYNSAFCLIYPSSYEGFGIPVLEAMKAGCPVVSTNLSSIPEVAGDAALLVDEVSVSAFANEIRRLEGSDFRDSIIQKGFDQASKFTWDKCFEETYAFYQELWERSDIK